MKASQLKSIFAILLLGAIAFTSCKKDSPSPEEALIGRWAGKYGSGDPDNPFAFNFLSNGVLQLLKDDNSVKAVGTWKINGNQVSGIYEYSPNDFYKFTGTYNRFIKKISGLHGEDDDYDANFFLIKE